MCLCLFLCCITPTVEGLQLLKLTSNSNRYLICQIYINSPFFPVAAKCVHNIRTGPLTYCVVIHLQWPLFSGQGCGESVAWGIEHWRSGGNAGREAGIHHRFFTTWYILHSILNKQLSSSYEDYGSNGVQVWELKSESPSLGHGKYHAYQNAEIIAYFVWEKCKYLYLCHLKKC